MSRQTPNIVTGEKDRETIAQSLADAISEAGLTNPFGGNVYKSESRKGRSFYGVDFSRPRVLDGSVQVYGTTFIRIISRGPAEQPATVCRSLDQALEMIRSFA